MILRIDTTEGDKIEVALKSGGAVVARKKVSARFTQSEKLLPLIDKLLRDNKVLLKNIKSIEVNNKGGSFTALRIGVVTANALGYAAGLRTSGVGCRISDAGFRERGFNVVEPIYNKEPSIAVKNNL